MGMYDKEEAGPPASEEVPALGAQAAFSSAWPLTSARSAVKVPTTLWRVRPLRHADGRRKTDRVQAEPRVASALAIRAEAGTAPPHASGP